jgi:hypothetical protein
LSDNLDKRPMEVRLPIWPVVVVCLFSMTSAAVKIGGIPVATMFTSLFSVLLLAFVRKIYAFPAFFALVLLVGTLPGAIVAAVNNTIEMMSFANLLAGLFAFVIVYTYTYRMLHGNREILLGAINAVLIIFIILALSELLFYDQFCSVRKSIYQGVIEGIICQASDGNREALLYNFPRPSAIFSEPSNFARFLSIFFAMHFVLSKNRKLSIILFIFLLLFTRSPTFLYSSPVIAFSFIYSNYEDAPPKLNFSNLFVMIIPASAIGVLFYILQSARIQAALQGEDDSLGSRIVNPFRFMVDAWQHPFLGSGPTPYGIVNKYVSEFFINATGRYWLYYTEYTNAISPTPLLLVGWGIMGSFMVLYLNALFFGARGVWLLIIFLATNILNTGTNSPTMFVPSALSLALAAFIWREENAS